MEIRKPGEKIVTQVSNRALDAFGWHCRNVMADDETISYHGESLSLLSKLLDRPLEAFLTDRTHAKN